MRDHNKLAHFGVYLLSAWSMIVIIYILYCQNINSLFISDEYLKLLAAIPMLNIILTLFTTILGGISLCFSPKKDAVLLLAISLIILIFMLFLSVITILG